MATTPIKVLMFTSQDAKAVRKIWLHPSSLQIRRLGLLKQNNLPKSPQLINLTTQVARGEKKQFWQEKQRREYMHASHWLKSILESQHVLDTVKTQYLTSTLQNHISCRQTNHTSERALRRHGSPFIIAMQWGYCNCRGLSKEELSFWFTSPTCRQKAPHPRWRRVKRQETSIYCTRRCAKGFQVPQFIFITSLWPLYRREN